jgi:hypothetical protein
MKMVKETRKISRAKLYRINEKNELVKDLINTRISISDYFVYKELSEQEKQNVKIDDVKAKCLA